MTDTQDIPADDLTATMRRSWIGLLPALDVATLQDVAWP